MSDNESRRCLTTKCALLLPTLAMLLQQFINAGANGTFLLLYGINKSKHIFSFTGLYYLSIPVLTQLAVKPMEDAANNRTPNATVTIKPQMFALIRDFGASLILMTAAVIKHRKRFCPQLKHIWRLALIGASPVQSILHHTDLFFGSRRISHR